MTALKRVLAMLLFVNYEGRAVRAFTGVPSISGTRSGWNPSELAAELPNKFVQLEAPPVVDVPVYSLATLDETSGDAVGATDMNILTYASPVGIRPHCKWALSLYRTTKTHENFLKRGEGVLQLLRRKHSGLVYVLGGQSGRDVDKAGLCEGLGFKWGVEVEEGGALGCAGLQLLPGCAVYYKVVLDGDLIDAGDHDVAIVRIEAICEPEVLGEGKGKIDGADKTEDNMHMYTGFLREKKIISDKGRANPPEELEQ